jgi:multidrug transporter EmrE-like cation transporter
MDLLFREHLWPGLAICTALYISDYWLTMVCARMYRSGVNEKIVLEGSIELTPRFQKDIDSGRIISPRFVSALAMVVGILAGLWFLADAIKLLELYSFGLGVLILAQLATHQRHVQNYSLFHAVKGIGGLSGRIEYSRRLILRQSSTAFLSFASIYAVVFLFTESWFVLGGSFGCLAIALRHLRLANAYIPPKPT